MTTPYSRWETLSARDLAEVCVSKNLTDEQRGEIANLLVGKICDEESLAPLALLFDCKKEVCQKTLTFVLSEIGPRAINGMEWLDDLMSSSNEWIRHYSIVGVQASGSLTHGMVAAKAIRAIGDVRSVRLASLRFLANGHLPQIETAKPFLSGQFRRSVTQLVDEDFEDIERDLMGDDDAISMIALARAQRLGWVVSPKLLADRPALVDAAAWLNRVPLRS